MPRAASDFDPTSHADFGAATHPGVGGGTHRRRATVERCSVLVGGVRLEVLSCACVCRCRGCFLCRCVLCACDLLIVLHEESPPALYNDRRWHGDGAYHTCDLVYRMQIIPVGDPPRYRPRPTGRSTRRWFCSRSPKSHGRCEYVINDI